MHGLQDDRLRNPVLISSVSSLFCLLILNFLDVIWIFFILISFLLFSILFCFILKNKIFAVACVSCLISCCAFIIKLYTNDSIINSFEGKELTVIGYSTDLPVYSEGKCRYNVRVEKIKGIEKIPKFNIEMVSDDDLYCDPFERFKIKLKILESNNLSDQIRLKSQGVKFSSVPYLYQNIERLDIKKNIKYYVLKIKSYILDCVSKIFDSKCDRLLRALVFRDRSRLTFDEKIAFSESGVFHFLAVSGFHFTLFTNILLNLLKFLKINRSVAYSLCCLFVIFFIIMVGFTPSVVRSGVMLLIYFLSKIFFKPYDSLNSLGLGLTLILILNMDACLDVGLWMSFVSSASLILFSDKIKRNIFSKLKLEKSTKILRYSLSNFIDSTVGTISTLPISCLYFKSFSILFFISNLFISILIYILITTFLISIIFYKIPFLNLTPKISNIISELIIKIIYNFSNFSFSLNYSFIPLCFSILFILISYFIIFKDIEKEILKIFLIFINLILTGIISYQLKRKNSFQIDILKGDIIISDQRQNIIIMRSDKLNRLHNYFNKNIVIINNNKNNLLENDKIINLSDNKIYEFNFSNKLNIIAFKIKSKGWIKIEIFDKIILVCMDGGNADLLPNKIKNCDIFLAFNLPNNLNQIKFKEIIFANNSFRYKFNSNKILNYNNLVSGEYDASILLKNNKYFIERK